jgi:hypothetical protein
MKIVYDWHVSGYRRGFYELFKTNKDISGMLCDDNDNIAVVEDKI